MSVSDESWIPRLEKRDDHWVVVHFAGREWFLMSHPKLEPRAETYRIWDGSYRGSVYDRATLSFDMALIPQPPDLSIPDNIILGDN